MQAEARAGQKRGRADQTKLAEYLAPVQETELRVQRQVEWVDGPKPVVEAGKFSDSTGRFADMG